MPKKPAPKKIPTALFPISSNIVSLTSLFEREFREAMVDLDDVDPGDIDWYVDQKGNLWTIQTHSTGHGYTFFNITKGGEFDRSEVKVVVD